MVLFYIIYMTAKYTRSQLESFPKRKLIEIILQQQDTITQLESTIAKLENTFFVWKSVSSNWKAKFIKTAIIATFLLANPSLFLSRISGSPPGKNQALSPDILALL